MEDLLNIDKIQFIIETYKEVRERFRQGDTYDPLSENSYFTDTYLGIEGDDRNNAIECSDLFLGYIHALFSIQADSTHGNWDNAVSNLKDFLTPSEEDDEWLGPGKEAIRTWVEQLDGKVEIPY